MHFSIVLSLALANSSASVATAPVTTPVVHSTQSAQSTQILAPVLVSGSRPGPRLWKVSKGEHVLWILGTVSPVPKNMEWYSPQSEAVLRQAQEIIGRPLAGGHVGWGSAFKAALALPTILKARKNPDGKLLREVLPAELYARWSVLKASYLPGDNSVEELRPIFAAEKLYSAALSKAGLRSGTGTEERIRKLEKEHGLKYTPNLVSHAITDPKGLAKSFVKARIDEVPCFRTVLDRLDADVQLAARRANAWAIGDLPELTRLVRRNETAACLQALAQVEAVRSMGMLDASRQAEAKWLQSVDTALAANPTSFATLPMAQILEADGLLARLKTKGYLVTAP